MILKPEGLPGLVQRALVAIAERHEAADLPADGDGLHDLWQAWFRAYAKQLPDLGDMPMPWDG